MTKRAVLCPWQSDQKSGSSISNGHETASDYLTSSFLYILLWGRCHRDLSTPPSNPPYNECDRNYHFIRRFASVPGKFIGVPSAFLFVFVDLSPPPLISLLSHLIADTSLPIPVRALGAYRRNRTWGKENPYKAAPCRTENTNRSHDLSQRSPAAFISLFSLRWHENILLARRTGNPDSLTSTA